MFPPYSYDVYDIYGAAHGISSITSIIYLLIVAAAVAGLWLLYQKAGEEGWAAIVPFYSSYIQYKITWGNGWFFLLLFIPFANAVIHIITMVKLAKAFGKGGGWACGLIFLYPVFLMIMAFSNEIQYVGLDGISGNYPGGNGPGGPGQYQNPYTAPNPAYQAPRQQQQSAQNPQYHYQTATEASSRETAEPQQSATKYCGFCGAPVDANAKFCPNCGKPRE